MLTLPASSWAESPLIACGTSQSAARSGLDSVRMSRALGANLPQRLGQSDQEPCWVSHCRGLSQSPLGQELTFPPTWSLVPWAYPSAWAALYSVSA